MTQEPLFLTKEQVDALHEYQLKTHGGQPGTRDENLLESAVAQPQHVHHYGQGDHYDIAAAYAYHIAENQPYLDGNKRTAIHAATVYLESNDIDTKSLPVDKTYVMMISIADKTATRDDLAEHFRNTLILERAQREAEPNTREAGQGTRNEQANRHAHPQQQPGHQEQDSVRHDAVAERSRSNEQSTQDMPSPAAKTEQEVSRDDQRSAGDHWTAEELALFGVLESRAAHDHEISGAALAPDGTEYSGQDGSARSVPATEPALSLETAGAAEGWTPELTQTFNDLQARDVADRALDHDLGGHGQA